MTDDAAGRERFKVMERKLYYGIMAPGAVLSIASGLWLWLGYGITGGWLYAKLALVAVLVGVSPVVRPLDRRLQARAQSPRARLVPVVQRVSDRHSDRGRGAGRGQAVLGQKAYQRTAGQREISSGV